MDINFLEVDSGKILDDVLSQLEQHVQEPLYPGDERRTFGEALAMVINAQVQTINDGCRQRLLRYARGDVLDALGENRGVSRIRPTPAETILQFSVENVLTMNVIIPAGIRVTGPDNLFFKTTQTVVLQAGKKTVNAPAESIDGGSQYNEIAVGKLDTIVDKSEIARISGVTNLVETFGGGNIEDDEALRERIRTAENAASCGTESSYRYWTISANAKIVDAAVSASEEIVRVEKTAKDAKVYLCAPDLIPGTLKVDCSYSVLSTDDDGLVTLAVDPTITTVTCSYRRKKDGVVTIMPILAGGEIPDDDVLDDVREVLNRPEVKPLTDKIEVLAPKTVPYDIELEYWTTSLDEAEVVQTIEGSGGVIDDYIFWQDSTSQDINPDQLAKRVLCPHTGGTGATRARVILPVYRELDKTEVAKWSGKLTVRHSVRG